MEDLPTIIPSPQGVTFRERADIPNPDKQREQIIEDRKNQTKEMPNEVKTPVKVPPLSLYERIRHKPYSVDYFDLGLSWQFSNFPQEIETIENFVRDEIQKYSLENSTQSYRDILAKLESAIGIKPTERVWKKMDRLVGYIKASQMADKWNKKKREMEVSFSGET